MKEENYNWNQLTDSLGDLRKKNYNLRPAGWFNLRLPSPYVVFVSQRAGKEGKMSGVQQLCYRGRNKEKQKKTRPSPVKSILGTRCVNLSEATEGSGWRKEHNCTAWNSLRYIHFIQKNCWNSERQGEEQVQRHNQWSTAGGIGTRCNAFRRRRGEVKGLCSDVTGLCRAVTGQGAATRGAGYCWLGFRMGGIVEKGWGGELVFQ